MKKGIFILLSRFAFSLVLGLFFCCANAITLSPFGGLGGTISLPNVSPDTPGTTTTTGQALFSGQVTPPGGFNSSITVTPYYAGVAVPSQAVVNGQFPTLCPASPVCPDINGKTLNNAPANCPQTCTVARKVTTSTNGSFTTITSTTNAVCPSGYDTVGSYNDDKEIELVNNPPPAPFPITSMSTYADYVSAGYNCVLIPQGIQSMCGGTGVPASSLNSALTSTSASPIAPFYYVGQFQTGGAVQTNGMVGGPDPQHWCAQSPQYDAYPCQAICPSGPPLYLTTNIKYAYWYAYVQCTPPAGLFYTGNMVPTSLVCAVRQSTWQQGH